MILCPNTEKKARIYAGPHEPRSFQDRNRVLASFAYGVVHLPMITERGRYAPCRDVDDVSLQSRMETQR